VAGTIALLALGGPTPGYVGSCSAGSPAVVDAQQFCVDRKVAECVRDRVALRTDDPQYQACMLAISSSCEGATWNGCAPSAQIADACISALRDMTRIGTPNTMIVECYTETLCGAAPLVTPDDDGI
jgi:hypothetical protein